MLYAGEFSSSADQTTAEDVAEKEQKLSRMERVQSREWILGIFSSFSFHGSLGRVCGQTPRKRFASTKLDRVIQPYISLSLVSCPMFHKKSSQISRP